MNTHGSRPSGAAQSSESARKLIQQGIFTPSTVVTNARSHTVPNTVKQVQPESGSDGAIFPNSGISTRRIIDQYHGGVRDQYQDYDKVVTYTPDVGVFPDTADSVLAGRPTNPVAMDESGDVRKLPLIAGLNHIINTVYPRTLVTAIGRAVTRRMDERGYAEEGDKFHDYNFKILQPLQLALFYTDLLAVEETDTTIITFADVAPKTVAGLLEVFDAEFNSPTKGFVFTKPNPNRCSSSSTSDNGEESGMPFNQLSIPAGAASFVVNEPGLHRVELSHPIVFNSADILVLVLDHSTASSTTVNGQKRQLVPLRAFQDASTEDVDPQAALNQRSAAPINADAIDQGMEGEPLQGQVFGAVYDQADGVFKLLRPKMSSVYNLAVQLKLLIGTIEPARAYVEVARRQASFVTLALSKNQVEEAISKVGPVHSSQTYQTQGKPHVKKAYKYSRTPFF